MPHLYARSAEALFYAFGWAQMQNHRSTLLRLYGKARGRAAEYWGEQYLDSDIWIHLMSVPQRARVWRKQQTPSFGRFLDAFAAGINDYAAKKRKTIPPELLRVLPVTSADVLAHVQAVVHYYFIVNPAMIGGNYQPSETAVASNAWAIAPSFGRGRTMLLGNPHLPWEECNTFFEAQFRSDDVNFYGACLVGFPVPMMGFSPFITWTHTANRAQAFTTYELSVRGGAYRYDRRARHFRTHRRQLRIRLNDGRVRVKTLEIRHSIHGPIVSRNGARATALRVAGLDVSGICEQWWSMACASNLAAFEAALRRLQIPMFNVLYADRDGRIMYMFGGRIPVRREGAWNWAGLVPGDTSETFWNTTHGYDQLPRVVNPASGWLQNANDPPLTSTLPPAIASETFPRYFQHGPPIARAQRSLRMLSGRTSISFEEILSLKHCTHSEIADRILCQLVQALRETNSRLALETAVVLDRWDHCTRPESRGAVLFLAFLEAMLHQSPGFIEYAEPWRVNEPLSTPCGLRYEQRVVDKLVGVAVDTYERYGSLAVSWGEVYRLRRGSVDLPALGGPDLLGGFRVLEFNPCGDNKYSAKGGDAFMFAVEFDGSSMRARTLLPFGNATEPESPHSIDQVELYNTGQWREPFLTAHQIGANLNSVERLGGV